jgi:hypothetical protein
MAVGCVKPAQGPRETPPSNRDPADTTTDKPQRADAASASGDPGDAGADAGGSVSPPGRGPSPKVDPPRDTELMSCLAGIKRERGINTSAAAAALAAVNIDSCKPPGGPVAVDVHITFAPSGEATAAVVEQPFVGTPTGLCIAKNVRRVRIPSFEGEPVIVGKRFLVR